MPLFVNSQGLMAGWFVGWERAQGGTWRAPGHVWVDQGVRPPTVCLCHTTLCWDIALVACVSITSTIYIVLQM